MPKVISLIVTDEDMQKINKVRGELLVAGIKANQSDIIREAIRMVINKDLKEELFRRLKELNS